MTKATPTPSRTLLGRTVETDVPSLEGPITVRGEVVGYGCPPVLVRIRREDYNRIPVAESAGIAAPRLVVRPVTGIYTLR
jgi:hypothetical protein